MPQRRSQPTGLAIKIGEYYEKGLGVAQDYRAAANWYMKALDASNRDQVDGRARTRLAFLYANGIMD